MGRPIKSERRVYVILSRDCSTER